jgi:tRNA dimethylallyltransferase
MSMNNQVIIIVGPTGIGKSDVALLLAQKIAMSGTPAHVINADIGSFYTPLTIGTAKPNWRDEVAPHHLFDIIDEPKNFSVIAYRHMVSDTLKVITAQGHVPIIVGGSSFYINALFFPPYSETLNAVHKQAYSDDTHALWKRLYEFDPQRAREIDMNDRYRITRALDIWHATGTQPSVFKPRFDPIAPRIALFCLFSDMQKLYQNINARTQKMIATGWIDEVRHLAPAWHTFLLGKKMIGYDDIIHHVRSVRASVDEQGYIDDLVATIQQKTRHYAKRQVTFNRMLIKKLEEHRNGVYTELINVDTLDVHTCASVIERKIAEISRSN